MRPPRIGQWSATVGLLFGIGALLAATTTPLPVASGRVETSSAGASLEMPAARPDSLVTAAVTRDPFRMTRRPAGTPYDPTRAGQGVAAFQGAPKPALRLVGLIRGAPMGAVLEGLPGSDGGRVVRQGDSVGPLRVAGITAGGVRIVGLDTTWTLTLRRR